MVPTYCGTVDLRALALQGVELAAGFGLTGVEIPEGDPVRMAAWIGQRERRYRGGFSIDLGGAVEVFKPLMALFPSGEASPDSDAVESPEAP